MSDIPSPISLHDCSRKSLLLPLPLSRPTQRNYTCTPTANTRSHQSSHKTQGKYVTATEQHKLQGWPPQLPYFTVKCRVTCRLVNIPPLYIDCTQHLGHTDDSRSAVKMFLRVVILVFAATCCTARVICKAVHTRHWYIRSATDLQQVPTWSKLLLPHYSLFTPTYTALWSCREKSV